jgi:hypothetical protein
MLFIRGIKMSAGRGGFGIGAITELMNVEPVFAGRQSGYVSNDLHDISRSGESNGAAHVTAGSGMQNRDGFGGVGSRSDAAGNEKKQQSGKNCFHDATLQPATQKCKRRARKAEVMCPA